MRKRFGQVAQLVEQGTENPRVGGSTPSLATILPLLVCVIVGTACGSDACERLCDRVGNRIGTCLSDWPATWEDLDADSRAGFQDSCRQSWADEATDLEPRELDDALDQCSEAIDALTEMRQDDTECDQLRALYLD